MPHNVAAFCMMYFGLSRFVLTTVHRMYLEGLDKFQTYSTPTQEKRSYQYTVLLKI